MIYEVVLTYEVSSINSWIPKTVTFTGDDICKIYREILHVLESESWPIRNVKVE